MQHGMARFGPTSASRPRREVFLRAPVSVHGSHGLLHYYLGTNLVNFANLSTRWYPRISILLHVPHKGNVYHSRSAIGMQQQQLLLLAFGGDGIG